MLGQNFDLKELFTPNVSFLYIPKLDGRMEKANLELLVELKNIEKTHLIKWSMVGLNFLYFYMLFEQRFLAFRKLKPFLMFGLPLGFYSYGYYSTKNAINTVFNPLFKEEFENFKKNEKELINQGKNPNKSNSSDQILEKFAENNKELMAYNYTNIDKTQLMNHIKFISEWLFEPLDEDFENKLYFIENAQETIDQHLFKTWSDNYVGLRFKKL